MKRRLILTELFAGTLLLGISGTLLTAAPPKPTHKPAVQTQPAKDNKAAKDSANASGSNQPVPHAKYKRDQKQRRIHQTHHG